MPNEIQQLKSLFNLEDICSEHTNITQSKYGKGLIGICPLHEEDTASFTIDQDKQLWYCFGCAKGGDIIEYICQYYGLTVKESILFLKEKAGIAEDYLTLRVKEKDKIKIARTEERKKKEVIEKPFGEIDKRYQYTDSEGKILYESIRLKPKDFRQRTWNGQRWEWTLKGVSLVPYNLKAVKDAKTVYIVEGEKDVDSLGVLGLVASCNPCGAGKWKETYNVFFQGKTIYIIPDRDTPGRNHAKMVKYELSKVSKRVKIASPVPVYKKGADVSDWIEAGATREDIIKHCQTTTMAA